MRSRATTLPGAGQAGDRRSAIAEYEAAAISTRTMPKLAGILPRSLPAPAAPRTPRVSAKPPVESRDADAHHSLGVTLDRAAGLTRRSRNTGRRSASASAMRRSGPRQRREKGPARRRGQPVPGGPAAGSGQRGNPQRVGVGPRVGRQPDEAARSSRPRCGSTRTPRTRTTTSARCWRRRDASAGDRAFRAGGAAQAGLRRRSRQPRHGADVRRPVPTGADGVARSRAS